MTSVDSSSPAGVETTTRASVAVRWWPAVVLLLVGVLLKLIPRFIESPSLPIIMTSFMGPAAIAALILVWWLFASRIPIREKLLGFVGVLAVAIISIAMLHFTLAGMIAIIFVLPTGFAAFTLGFLLFMRLPMTRTLMALLCAVVGFGYWDLQRSEGVTGSFAPELGWRWEPSPEEAYIAELEAHGAASADRSDAVATVLVDASTAEWPGFRGPYRNGNQSGVAIVQDWSANPPKEIWKSKIGPGWSSFVVAGNVLFTQEQRGDNEVVICLDANTGEMKWDYLYPSRFWEAIAGAGPRATPTLAASGLFALGADGILVALDPNSGAELWKHDLRDDANRKPPMWGFSSSPLVEGGLVIVHAGGANELGILAYDEKTGDLKWSVKSGDHSYSSPQLATFEGTTGILMQTNWGLQFIRVEDGATIWEHEWSTENYRAIQPLVVGNSVLMATSLGLGTRKLEVSKSDDQWTVDVAWTSLDMKPDFNDFVEYQGYLYGFDGSIFACVDLKDGKRQWKKGRYGSGQVLLLSDSGQMLISSEKGEIVLVQATPDKLTEIAKLPLIEGKTWNHPVLVGNRLYIRNGQEIACIELPTEPVATDNSPVSLQ